MLRLFIVFSRIENVNYVFFDPELNWCKACSVFPKTAKDFLTHLHSDAHKANIKTPETPWHETKTTDEFPTYPNANTKRIPIRGLQFFLPVTGWYCKLCSTWMGDLHCASTHLKSQTHSKNYNQYVNKNPCFEKEWESDRERANRTAPSELTAPPPPIISSRDGEEAKPENFLDLIPLQLNQKVVKDMLSSDDAKKSKKKKKDKKKRKKSKKKRQQSSSSSSSSSSDSESNDSDKKSSEEKPIDTAASIRVAMRKAQQAKQITDEDIGGKWTVVREAKPIAPQPPTISENGEADKQRDERIISQWNAPESIINDKEKQLLEQIKERMKMRDADKKKEEVPSSTTKPIRNENENRPKPVVDKRQRDRKRSHSRSRSPNPRRRRSRSPRRDYRRRSRSPRRRSNSRGRRSSSHSRIRSRNRRTRTRSRSRGRIEKAIVPNIEFKPRVPDIDKKKSENDRKKPRELPKKSSTSSGLKPSFIGRMPVFKKQTNSEDDNRKQDQSGNLTEEQRLLNEMKTQEFKFQIQQKQQLIQQQQKHAEAFNLANPGAFHSEYNQHGCIDHILPPVVPEDYEELMPDPMHFATIMTGNAPPPPPVVEVRRPEDNEPILPPGNTFYRFLIE